jgi:hypothetical protein
VDENFPEPVVNEGVEEEPKKKRRCPIKLWILLIFVIVINIGVIGGVVGSTLRHRSRSSPQTSNNGPVQGTPVSSPSSTFIEAPARTGLSTPTATPIRREEFKFPSIAASHCEGTTKVQIFYIQSGALKVSISGGNGLYRVEELNPSIPLKAFSPLAVTSWVDAKANDSSTNVCVLPPELIIFLTFLLQIRLYYFDAQNRIIEISGRCVGDNDDSCDWGESFIVQSTGISNNSGISVVHHGNTTVLPSNMQIRVYYENTESTLAIAIYDSQEWGTAGTPINVMAGTAIAATTEVFSDKFAGQVRYIGPDKRLWRRAFIEDNWLNRRSLIQSALTIHIVLNYLA